MNMFSCVGHSKDHANIASSKIDKDLKRDKKKYKALLRLLLLGAGESGKSTIVKQMQILHVDGFDSAYRTQKIEDIRKNVRDSILSITGAMNTIEPPVPLADPARHHMVEYIQTNATLPNFNYSSEFYTYTEELWKDDGVQQTFKRSNEYQLIDCAQYFLDQISTIRQPDYVPTEQDILRCRVLTCGVFETKFTCDKIHFHMFDVGGQRDERRKWIQCFYGITAVIFVAATSSYDLTLREDSNQNRVRESLQLFESTWRNRFLEKISVILFLNKQDVLEEKVMKQQTQIKDYFKDFENYKLDSQSVRSSGENPECLRAKYFFRDEFLKINNDPKRYPNRHIYPHFTCAVDTENIRRVFNDCKDIIQRENLGKYDLL